MAAPITHVVLAEGIYNSLFKDQNKRNFFVGTCFPDIRYLGVIEREKTHFHNIDLKKLKQESAFVAGLKLHSFIDKEREDFLLANKNLLIETNFFIGNNLSSNPVLSNRVLKLAEDELFYQRINSWREKIRFLDNVLREEIDFDIERKEIERWHSLLVGYFSAKPTSKTREDFLKGLNFKIEDIGIINSLVDKATSDSELVALIDKLYNHFNILLK